MKMKKVLLFIFLPIYLYAQKGGDRIELEKYGESLMSLTTTYSFPVYGTGLKTVNFVLYEKGELLYASVDSLNNKYHLNEIDLSGTELENTIERLKLPDSLFKNELRVRYLKFFDAPVFTLEDCFSGKKRFISLDDWKGPDRYVKALRFVRNGIDSLISKYVEMKKETFWYPDTINVKCSIVDPKGNKADQEIFLWPDSLPDLAFKSTDGSKYGYYFVVLTKVEDIKDFYNFYCSLGKTNCITYKGKKLKMYYTFNVPGNIK